jgi:hypothetical protein
MYLRFVAFAGAGFAGYCDVERDYLANFGTLENRIVQGRLIGLLTA